MACSETERVHEYIGARLIPIGILISMPLTARKVRLYSTLQTERPVCLMLEVFAFYPREEIGVFVSQVKQAARESSRAHHSNLATWQLRRATAVVSTTPEACSASQELNVGSRRCPGAAQPAQALRTPPHFRSPGFLPLGSRSQTPAINNGNRINAARPSPVKN
jgi:hypothetical protein